MRKELVQSICNTLQTIPEIKHIDLWNRNVEFIEQETPWARPAVFIELSNIEWKPFVGIDTLRTQASFLLHIVTDWTNNGTQSPWDLSLIIARKLHRLSGDNFAGVRLLQSATNHNHEEIVETIDTYSYTAEISLNDETTG